MAGLHGFRDSDFGQQIAGTTWCGRDSLGGWLAQTLRTQLQRPYQSWAVKRRLMLHLALEDAYDGSDPWPYAKLYASTRCDTLKYGFWVKAPHAEREDFAKFKH